MKVFFDTNVLVAACVRQHPHFVRADSLLRSCSEDNWEVIVHAHSLLEFHSALTQLPGGLAVPPLQVNYLLAEGILPYVQLRAITADEVLVVQKRAGEQGVSGGIIYDLYHLAVAEKEGVDRFYTFNTRHFQSLATSVMLERIITP